MRKVLLKLIVYLNVLAAVCLLISYTAPYINPAKLLFPAFFGLSYPYLLILNLLFLIYWTIRFQKPVVISLIAILIGWSHLMNFMPLHFSKLKGEEVSGNANTETLKIMSYNVRAFDQFKWSDNENSRADIFELINIQSPDIVCLQEFYTVNRKGSSEEDIHDLMSIYEDHVIYYSKKTGNNSGIGIATYSRFPIVKTSRIPFNETRNQAVYADIEYGNDTIRIFNIHLQSIKLAQNNYSFIDTLSLIYSNRQMKEVKEIGMKLRDAFVQRSEQSIIIHRYIEASPYPVIVTGDFNDTPISFAYNTIKKGLIDAFRETGKGLGNTYAGELPSFRIDFILYSKDLQSVEFNRIKVKNSDHFPIIAKLKKNTFHK